MHETSADLDDPAHPRVTRRKSWPWRVALLADRHRRWWLAGAFLLLLAGFNGQWRPGPDSAIYATIARQLAEGRGFTHPTGDEWLANPGLPCLVAATFRCCGVDVMWPAVTLLFLGAVATLALTYLWMCRHARRGVAVIVTVLLAINSTFYRHSLDVLTDVPFLLGVMLSLLGYEMSGQAGRRNVVVGWSLLAAGLGVMAAFRLVWVIVAAALLVALSVRAMRQRRWSSLAATVLVLAIPVAIRGCDPRATDAAGLVPKEAVVTDYLRDRRPEIPRHAFTEYLPELLGDVAPKAMFGNRINGHDPWLDGFVTLVVLAAGLMLFRRRMLWGLLLVFFLLQWLLFGLVPRYFLPILPILIYGWWRFACWLAWVILPHHLGRGLAALLILFYAGMNVARTAGFVIEQRSVPFLSHYRGGQFEGAMELGRELRQRTAPDAWVLTPEPWQAVTSFVSTRRTAAWRWGGPPPDQDPAQVYVLEPSDEPTRQMLRARGWEAGEAICALPRRSASLPLTVHRLRAQTHADPTNSQNKSL